MFGSKDGVVTAKTSTDLAYGVTSGLEKLNGRTSECALSDAASHSSGGFVGFPKSA